MNGAGASIIFSVVTAIAYGALFHLIFGGALSKLLLYIAAALIGFTGGHFLGGWLDLTQYTLGTVHLLSASLGAWGLLFLTRWLWGAPPEPL